jgi:hypothetical protein
MSLAQHKRRDACTYSMASLSLTMKHCHCGCIYLINPYKCRLLGNLSVEHCYPFGKEV